MNWKKYEIEILTYFQETYPETTITFDKKIIGKFSKVERQIDIFIEGEIAGYEIKIVVDCKYFSKNIDVKQIESFCSMVEDVDAHQGVLITKKGYSKAAINRAYYGNQKVELDIINFDKIKESQSFTAIPYVGNFSVIIPAPFGWVLDLKDSINNFATLFQRGLTLKEAQKKNEWMYVQFWKKEKSILTIDNLIEFQNEYIQENSKAEFEYKSGPKRKDNNHTKIRIADVELYPSLEVTGYIEFDNVIFYIVLFTPIELLNKNLRKLQHLLSTALPLKIKFDNTKVIEQSLKEIPYINDNEEKSSKFYQIAVWFKEMKDKENEILYLKKSLEKFPNYSSLKSIINESLHIGDYKESNKYSIIFSDIESKNPRTFQDLIEIYLNHSEPQLIETFLKDLRKKYTELETLGNINFHLGILNSLLGKDNKANSYFKLAKKDFKKVLPKNHHVFKALNEQLK
ncbi:restriction endonuclease [Tenacibaculum dicentrarchi]|uniref:restriction endonuclease n=1 Tax=Tenacibaculum finnmarkense TaxID=2781243 RepID=UPI000C49001D|nr:restriction endonuclease [Tenacibaculum finnmarkense]MCD8416111.1 restriction endonuclease [Tenacibaculum dicentrarchi]MCD8421239.1 restriction endonuclease [Tenacibaculum dicentrarchi]MCD8438397.1 restriction endonuclease [Tenacibaculum dicentrarchi]MCD8445688.1 restriction endonuclease [Tenacibaculum finnmarkense genomovar ulcerans]MCD8452758.1 restriction endonuclease [Tenacibaculum dicentrarchi]